MQSVLVTGCSSGFGLLAAVTLARNGFRVFASMRDLEKRAPLEAALSAAGARAELLTLDVTNAASIAAAVAAVVARAGRIDALVNNAGFGIGGFVEDMTLEEYRRQFDTNFFGTVAVTKAVLPQLRRQGAGRICMVSSIAGRAANPVISAYAASKFALEGFSEALAFEARLFGVDIVLIEPGTFKTEIFAGNRQLAAAARDPASPYFALSRAVEAKVDAIVARHGGEPQKVADAILKALTVRRPRLRYLVGTDAKLAAGLHRFGGLELYAAAVRRVLGIGDLADKLRPAR